MFTLSEITRYTAYLYKILHGIYVYNLVNKLIVVNVSFQSIVNDLYYIPNFIFIISQTICFKKCFLLIII
jgi:hypothetical protein